MLELIRQKKGDGLKHIEVQQRAPTDANLQHKDQAVVRLLANRQAIAGDESSAESESDFSDSDF